MSSYIPIASQTLGSSAASVTFSSIPTTLNGKTLRDLVLVTAIPGAGFNNVFMRFNSDTGSNYSYVQMTGDGSSFFSSASTQSSVVVGSIGSGQGNIIANIMDYAVTNKHKSVLSRSNTDAYVEAFANRWANTAAITALELRLFSGSFATGSTFNLFGVEG